MARSKIFLSDGVTELSNIKSVVFKEAVNAEVNIRPGCVSSASIEVEVYNTQANAVSAGDVVYYYQIDKNDVQTLIGEFVCEPSIETKTSYKFIAYDNAQKLNADFSEWLQANQSSFPMTVYAIVSAACSVAGVTLGSSSWGLSTENVQAFYADGITCRDVLSYAAEIGCCFVRCHSNGSVYFDWYSSSSYAIAPSVGVNQYAYKQDGLTYANYATAVLDRVAVHPSGEDDVAYIYPVSAASGNTLHIQNNLLLTGADASFYEAVAQRVYTNVYALGAYRPMTANLFVRENPFRAGDIVTVTDIQNVTFTSIITSLTVSSSAAVLESTGYEVYDEGSGNTQKAIAQLSSDIVRINKLKVDWADIGTAIVNYLTANNVTAQNLTIVDENGNVLATYDSSGIVLGNVNEVHAEIDFNSFKLYDQDGTLYASIGDTRDSTGIASVVDVFVTFPSQTEFTLSATAEDASAIVVSVDGTVQTSGYTATTAGVTFATPLAQNRKVEISYTTEDPVYNYILGIIASGTNVGTFAIAFGKGSTASGIYSVVGGGENNTALTSYATVSGGNGNSASGLYSTIGGGVNNRAIGTAATIGGGRYNEITRIDSVISGGINNEITAANSSIGGGASNTASGYLTTIAGGQRNGASGMGASVGGGESNLASGDYSTIPGGDGNIANHKGQMVFGEFNEADPSANAASARGNYVEIVGNGTDDTSRSNARTLDWNGNETLAGGLEANDNISTSGLFESERASGTYTFYSKNTDIELGTAPSSASRQYIGFVDNSNSAYAYLSGSLMTDLRTGISLAAINNNQRNYLNLYISPAGVATVDLSAPSAWLDALGLGSISTTTTVSNICSAGSNITIRGATFSQWGKFAELTLLLTANAAIAINSTLVTLKSGHIPAQITYGIGSAVAVQITTAGLVRNQAAITSGNQFSLSATYMLP